MGIIERIQQEFIKAMKLTEPENAEPNFTKYEEIARGFGWETALTALSKAIKQGMSVKTSLDIRLTGEQSMASLKLLKAMGNNPDFPVVLAFSLKPKNHISSEAYYLEKPLETLIHRDIIKQPTVPEHHISGDTFYLGNPTEISTDNTNVQQLIPSSVSPQGLAFIVAKTFKDSIEEYGGKRGEFSVIVFARPGSEVQPLRTKLIPTDFLKDFPFTLSGTC
jgi:hypothetical protein